MFHDILKIYFKDLPGSKLVNARRYTIKTQSYDELTQEGWSRTIRPNMHLIMSILIERDGIRIDHSCPSCGAPCTKYTASKMHEQVQWYVGSSI